MSFFFGPRRAYAMLVNEGAESTFGTLDPQAIAQTQLRSNGAGPTTLQTLASGREPRDQPRTAGIASRRRRNA